MEIVDASGLPVGRLATSIAKQLMEGKDVRIVNAEQAIIIGSKIQIINDYKQKKDLGKHANKRKGPFRSRMPDKIMRRIVRGMLPYQKPRGKKAYKRLKVYIGVPKELERAEIVKLDIGKVTDRYITLAALSEALGMKEYGRTNDN